MAMNSTQGLSGGGKAKYTMNIAQFHGVDYANSFLEMSEQRSPDMINMICGSNGSIKCRNGYDNVFQFESRINGIYCLDEKVKKHILVHYGEHIAEWKQDAIPDNEVYYGFMADNVEYKFLSERLPFGAELVFNADSEALTVNGTDTSFEEGEGDYYIKLSNGSEPETKNIWSGSNRWTDDIRLKVFDFVLPDRKSSCQQLNNKLYIFTGEKAYVYGEFAFLDKNGVETKMVEYDLRPMSEEAYVPTVIIGASAGEMAGGTAYENVNLLTPRRKNTFCISTDTATKLYLSTSPIEEDVKIKYLTSATGQFEEYTGNYTVETLTGVITFTEALPKTPITGADNIEVEFSATTATGTTLGEVFMFSKYEQPSTGVFKFDNPYTSRFEETVVNGVAVTGTKTILKYKDLETFLQMRFEIDGNNRNADLGGEIPFDGEWRHCNYYNASGYKYYVSAKCVQNERDVEVYVTDSYETSQSKCLGLTSTGKSIKIIWTEKNQNSYIDRIDKANISTKFGYGGNLDRLFVAGWDSMREYEFWSEINNPLYFPDLNYACCGDEDTAIMGWSRIDNNQIAVHKSSNGQDPTIYVQSATMDDVGNVDFPVIEGASGTGVVCQRAFAVLNGEPLALSEEGVFATKLVADIPTDTKFASPRSFYINPKLKDMILSEAEAITHNNLYYLSVGDYVFVADGNQKYMIGGNEGYNYSYDWYVWDNVPARVWWVNNGTLYFGTNDGRICRFSERFVDGDEAIKCHWCSKPINFNQPAYYKKVKNVYVTVKPTEWGEVNIDYITDSVNKQVKCADVHTYGEMPITIPTNYKVKKIQELQVKVWANNAEPLEILNVAMLYSVSGKYKG